MLRLIIVIITFAIQSRTLERIFVILADFSLWSVSISLCMQRLSTLWSRVLDVSCMKWTVNGRWSDFRCEFEDQPHTYRMKKPFFLALLSTLPSAALLTLDKDWMVQCIKRRTMMKTGKITNHFMQKPLNLLYERSNIDRQKNNFSWMKNPTNRAQQLSYIQRQWWCRLPLKLIIIMGKERNFPCYNNLIWYFYSGEVGKIAKEEEKAAEILLVLRVLCWLSKSYTKHLSSIENEPNKLFFFLLFVLHLEANVSLCVVISLYFLLLLLPSLNDDNDETLCTTTAMELEVERRAKRERRKMNEI